MSRTRVSSSLKLLALAWRSWCFWKSLWKEIGSVNNFYRQRQYITYKKIRFTGRARGRLLDFKTLNKLAKKLTPIYIFINFVDYIRFFSVSGFHFLIIFLCYRTHIEISVKTRKYDNLAVNACFETFWAKLTRLFKTQSAFKVPLEFDFYTILLRFSRGFINWIIQRPFAAKV